jgi:hypothetical protein
MEMPSHRRQALLATGLTLGFMLLVAMGVADQGWAFAVAALLIASLAMGGLYLIFPHGLLFALGAANGLAIYVSLYVVIGRASFPDAADWSRSVAFLLPVLSFVLACWPAGRSATRWPGPPRPRVAQTSGISRASSAGCCRPG